MKFIICVKDNPNSNEIIMHGDNSFGYLIDKEGWDFQVSLNSSSSFILNFSSKSKKCTSCEGYFLKESKSIIKKNIEIINPISCSLNLDYNGDMREDIGVEYKNMKKALYYDENKNIIACGEIDDISDIYMFGIGQYAKIDSIGNLIALYVRLL